MILDPIAAIVEAIGGPKYEDTEQFQLDEIKEEEWWIDNWQKQTDKLLFPPRPAFPEEYWEMYEEPIKPTTTTFRPFIKGGKESKLKYFFL